jgi:hypothetical protein
MPSDPIAFEHLHKADSIAIAAQEADGSLPTQPVLSLESLAVAYVIVLNSLAETLLEHVLVPVGVDAQDTNPRRREIYAAVWAANRAALGASNLSPDERDRLVELVWRRLHVHWQGSCGSLGEATVWLERRSAEYLEALPRGSSISAANHLVKVLFEALGARADSFATRIKVIASLVGHRIISEVNHLNELKSQFRFV